jgi:hypothetical protein
VLQKYKVGVGRERFSDDEGRFLDYDAVYFPLYSPRENLKATETVTTKKNGELRIDKATVSQLEREQEINTDFA